MKNLKKLLVPVVSILMIFAMNSCGEKDAISNESRLHGKWNHESDFYVFKTDGEITEEGTNEFKDEIASIEFSSDNTFVIISGDGDSHTGNWSLSSEGKVLIIDGERYDVIAFSRKSLTIGISEIETIFGTEVEFNLEVTFKKD